MLESGPVTVDGLVSVLLSMLAQMLQWGFEAACPRTVLSDSGAGHVFNFGLWITPIIS